MASGTIDDPETQEVLATLSPPGDGVKRFNTTGDPVGSTRWYVLSAAWFLKWKISKGLEPGVPSPPGPIDNSDIVQSPDDYYTSLTDNDYRNFIIHPGLTLDTDYLLVSDKAWKLLSRLYGVTGPAIQRYSIAAGESGSTIEVLLKPVLVSIIPKRDKELKLAAPKPIFVSQRDDQNRLKERLIDIYNKKMCQGGSKASVVYSALWKLDPGTDLEELEKMMAQADGPIECPGVLIPKDKPLDSCDIASDDIVLLELWVLST